MKMLIAVLVSLALSFQSVQFKTSRVDWVEREIRGDSYRIYTTFITVHQINGQQVAASQFWRHAHTGMVIQAKVTRRAGLWWAARINLKE